METKSFLDEEDLTLDELCQRLKVKRDWVYQRVHAGTLPFKHYKLGGFLRFPASSIQKFIESQIRGGNAA